ncbi:Receptor-like serine/threonine-protein kinase ALE2 [Platanthera zijinensis]|uniref:Receptor-like serine/threonine-protein kinase ALE2 n=1 Tax=Platanthera zijinensis TaxID=2320716 RepID=A0AAP0G667_9ASPA
MGWRGRDLARLVLGVLIILSGIYESAARIALPSPSKPETVSQPLHFPHGAGFTISSASKISPPSSMKDTIAAPSIPIDSRRNHEPSPMIVPTGSSSEITVPHNNLNTRYPSSNSPSNPPKGRTAHSPDSATSPTDHRSGRIETNAVSSAFSQPPPASQHSASFLPTASFQAPMVSQALLWLLQTSNKRENYAPPPYDKDHVISPYSKTLIKISKNKRRHLAPPNFSSLGMNPSSHASVPAPKPKRPYAEVPEFNSAPLSPTVGTKRRNRGHYSPPTYPQGLDLSPIQATFSSSIGEISAAPFPAPASPPGYFIWQIFSPKPSPTSTSRGNSWAPSPEPKSASPPPPPNLDCGSMMCHPPLTNPSPGSSCACVLPIKIGLRLGIDLYTFFPLVSEFAKEIATGISMKQSQVHVMGANSATEDSAETDVLVHLVPLGKSFDNTTVFLTFEKFWQKNVLIQGSYFGDYGVLYVSYPGLPPSPPEPSYVDTEAYHSNNNTRRIRPLGVDVKEYKKTHRKSLIPIVAMLSGLALFSIIGAALFLIIKSRKLSVVPASNFESSEQPLRKSSGTVVVDVESGSSSASASFGSNIAAYAGSAKTFTMAEMERATSMFDDSRVIGEGGFGRVYQGTLEDGTMVAVKVLKRVDRQGESEFLAEVEMLGRLHHRNLVKLIGICAEEHFCCIVYELIPNGSVESHLHDMDKNASPLDWNSRVKIALGTARALAYLHEDSSPRVIHRDLKSSNILLEHDFTARVSDFGLARSALGEGKEHISTRVMGTFGYVDPEYAMTGHLLVETDVYSYGVVLVELLTGRKPVDMSQPPGQENLIAWTRHLLTNIEALETIIDPALGGNYHRDSVAKVAAIASLCVQPDVSSRPSMSEVVQALKLVRAESNAYWQSERLSADEISNQESVGLGQGGGRRDLELDGLCASSRVAGDGSGSFRRHSSSGPLRSGGSKPFWRRMRGLASASSSEHGFQLGFWSRRDRGKDGLEEFYQMGRFL